MFLFLWMPFFSFKNIRKCFNILYSINREWIKMNYKFNKDLCSPRMYVEFNSYVHLLLFLQFIFIILRWNENLYKIPSPALKIMIQDHSSRTEKKSRIEITKCLQCWISCSIFNKLCSEFSFFFLFFHVPCAYIFFFLWNINIIRKKKKNCKIKHREQRRPAGDEIVSKSAFTTEPKT